MKFSNETELQKAVNDDLRKLNIPFYHRKSSGGGHRVTSNVFTLNGNKCAWLDLIIYLPKANNIHVELKHGSDKPSITQNNFICEFTKLGYKCYVIWTWQDWEFIKEAENIK